MIPDRANKIRVQCQKLQQKGGRVQIREVAAAVGLMVSAFAGVKYGPLYYRALENDKTAALKCNGWNLEGKMDISPTAMMDLSWWVDNVDKYPNSTTTQPAKLTLKTDSSLKGWGGVIEGSEWVTGGRWSCAELKHHINYLEIKAILMSLQSLCSNLHNCHIKILCDNTTAVTYIRNMGGTKSQSCNRITREIMLWCMTRQINLSISHLAGRLNTEADRASREFQSDTEWSLDPSVLDQLSAKWGVPEIDLFASRLNFKLPKYVAWKPDPGAIAIDAFTVDWSEYKLIYCFPPFSLIGRVLHQLQQSRATAILIVPDWPTQFWYPRLLQLIIEPAVKIRNYQTLLTLPYQPDKIHPLYPNLKLLGCLVSAKH